MRDACSTCSLLHLWYKFCILIEFSLYLYKTWSLVSYFGFRVVIEMLKWIFIQHTCAFVYVITVHHYTLAFQFGVHKEKGSVCLCAFM
jgi:hypothetical protein